MQDAWSVKTNWDLYAKWEKIRDFIQKNSHVSDLSLNYLSAAGGSFPYFIASGHSSAGTSAPRLSTGLTTPGWKNKYPDFPRVSCAMGICTIAFEGTNTLTMDYLNSHTVQRTGIIAADFPGNGLIDAIINKNTFEVKKFVDYRTNRCITARNNTITLDVCADSATAQQKISLDQDTFRNQGLCMTTANTSQLENSSVTFSSCNKGLNQTWTYDDYHFVNVQKNQKWCLSTDESARKLRLNRCKSADNKQVFTARTSTQNEQSSSINMDMVIR